MLFELIDGAFMALAKAVVVASGRDPNKRDGTLSGAVSRDLGHATCTTYYYKGGFVRKVGPDLVLFDRLGGLVAREAKRNLSRGHYISPEEAATKMIGLYLTPELAPVRVES